jgi:nucleoid DNA-binding protein
MSDKTKKTKQDIVAAIAERTHQPKTLVNDVITSFQDVIKSCVANSESVTLTGFLSISTVKKPARKGRNPKTGKEVQIKAKTVVKVKAGKTLKEAVSK